MAPSPHSDEPSSCRLLLLLAGLLGIALLLRWHGIWNIGFYQDDSVSSSWLYEARMSDRGLFRYCWDFFKAMCVSMGRITPIYNFMVQPPIILIGENLYLYRIVQALAHLAALAAFGAWLKRSNAGFSDVFLAMLALAAIYEIRDYHDPAYSQATTVSTTALFGFLALERAEAWRRGVARRKGLALALSGLAALAAVLTHEFGIGFVVAAGLIAALAPGRMARRLYASAIVCLPALIILGIGALLKAKSTYSGTSFGSPSVSVIAATFFKQAFAGVPFSYRILDPDGLFAAATHSSLPNLVLAILGSLVVGSAVWLATRSRADQAPIATSTLLASAALFIVSAGLTSVSKKYQLSLRWGVGYSQVYLQYFCSAVLIAWGISRLTVSSGPSHPPRRWPHYALRAMAAITIGVTFAISFISSLVMTEHIDRFWRYPREALAVTLDNLHETKAPPASQIVVQRSYLQRWENYYFLFQHAGWRGNFLTAGDAVNQSPRNGGDANTLHLAYPRMIDGDDIVVLTLTRPNPTAAPASPASMIFALCRNSQKLEEGYLSVGPSIPLVTLRSVPTQSRRGWFFKRLDLAQTVSNVAWLANP